MQEKTVYVIFILYLMYVCMCVCVMYVCMYMCMWVHTACVEVGGQSCMSILASFLIFHRVFCSFLLRTPCYPAHLLPGSTDVCYHCQLSMGSRDPNSDTDTCLAWALFTEPSFKRKAWPFNPAKPIQIQTVQKSVSFPLGDRSSFCFHGQALLPYAWESFMKWFMHVQVL